MENTLYAIHSTRNVSGEKIQISLTGTVGTIHGILQRMGYRLLFLSQGKVATRVAPDHEDGMYKGLVARESRVLWQ